MTICDLDSSPTGMSWGRDDTIVFTTTGSQGLLRVPAVGGEPERLTAVDPEQEETDHLWPEVLPDGQAVLFTAWSGSAESSRLAAVSLDTGAVTFLLPAGSQPRYSPTGHLIYGVGGTLWAVGFDADQLAVIGSPVPVVENVNMKALGAANFSVSSNGSLVYVAAAGGGPLRTLVWVDRDGREEGLGYPAASYTRPRVSPEGTRVAVGVSERDNTDIWIYDLSRRTRTNLTTDPAIDRRPLWTPDGQRVVFESNRDGRALFSKLADGTGEAERLMGASEGATFLFPEAWSADGKTLVYWELVETIDIGLLSMEGERRSELLLATEFQETAPAISPDGGWIAYSSTESGEEQVYVQRFPDLGERVTVSTDGGWQPVWSPDGRELFYRGPPGMVVVPVETNPTFRAGTPEVRIVRGPVLLLPGEPHLRHCARRPVPDGQRGCS